MCVDLWRVEAGAARALGLVQGAAMCERRAGMRGVEHEWGRMAMFLSFVDGVELACVSAVCVCVRDSERRWHRVTE